MSCIQTVKSSKAMSYGPTRGACAQPFDAKKIFTFFIYLKLELLNNFGLQMNGKQENIRQ